MLTSPALLTNPQSAGQSAENSLSRLGEDYESFLTLLTAQLTNQDPLSPVDSTDFVAQLAQLSQVEQAVQTNDRIETLTQQVFGLMNLNGAHLIGKEVKAQSTTLRLEGGNASATYLVADGAISLEARIVDPLKRVVRSVRGLPAESGQEHALNWDGLDDFGELQLEGKYSVELDARNADGERVDASLYRAEEVTEVIFHEGDLLLTLFGGDTVSSTEVVSVSQ